MILLLIYYMAKLVRAEKELSYWFPERSEFSYTDRSRKDLTKSRERVFHQDIQTPRSGLKNEAQPIFFDRLRGVWMPDETLFRVYDMASQTIHNSWRNSKQKFANFYANYDPVSKPPSR